MEHRTENERGPEPQPGFRSGFAAIVGRPNVGKSTLLNGIVGQKVTIVSDKPQTTRNAIQCVWNTPSCQVVFVDTPGIHRPHDRLGEKMMAEAEGALAEVDLVLFVVDAAAGTGAGDRRIAHRLTPLAERVVLVANKLDRIPAGQRPERLAACSELLAGVPVFGISAQTGEGVDALLEHVAACMPEGPPYFPPDWVTDHPERFVVAELVREKALQLTRDEVPHAIAVEVERMAKRPDRELVDIEATILVERESQKGIVIGHKGSLLRQIGSLARPEIEALLGTQVNLQLWVRVEPDWREKERVLRALGYR